MSVEYDVMAFDVPIKIKGMWFTHEEEFGSFPTLEKALKKAIQVSKKLDHPLELFRICKYGANGSRLLFYKSASECLANPTLKRN